MSLDLILLGSAIMTTTRLAPTIAEIARIQGGIAPPVMPDLLSGDVRVTARWRHEPFEMHLAAMEDHVIAAKYAGVGTATLKVGGSLYSSQSASGTITLAPRGHDGDWRVTGAAVCSNVFLGPGRLQACADEVAGGLVPELMDRLHHPDLLLFEIMRMISVEVSSPGATSTLFLEHLIDLFCLQLLRAHSSLSTAIFPASRRGLAGWQVRRVTGYMREHLGDDIKLQDLANLVHLSRFHFCTAFRLATGHTPHAWLTASRIDSAQQLLRDLTLDISEVALAVGYQTPSAFAAAFRRIVGVTPTEFRRRL